MPLGARASGRTAQTAATQGRLVRVCHSWARSNHWQGPTAFFDRFAGFEREEGGVADEDGGVCLLEHGDWVGGAGRNAGWVSTNLRKRISA